MRGVWFIYLVRMVRCENFPQKQITTSCNAELVQLNVKSLFYTDLQYTMYVCTVLEKILKHDRHRKIYFEVMHSQFQLSE